MVKIVKIFSQVMFSRHLKVTGLWGVAQSLSKPKGRWRLLNCSEQLKRKGSKGQKGPKSFLKTD